MAPSVMGTPVRAVREGANAYERYLAGMDATMRQKIALTAAHLLGEGRVADMGMGSGQGSHALAALYPHLQVVGVDLDPVLVERARATHVLPNLSFACGDIAAPVFPAGSLDGILDCSVLHHVTSFGGYRHENAAEALAVQVEQLREHGVLVVRDFVDPGGEPVLLDLPSEDGHDGSDPRTCSTARLLELFARQFRALGERPGFPLERLRGDEAAALPEPLPGWRRYRLQHKHAAELLLRKDYRTDWEDEVKEEYTYFTRAGFEEIFARLGLRVLASTPIWNPWIVRHRFEGKMILRDAAGRPLDPPPTNYVIVGEKVPRRHGVGFRATPAPTTGFLRLQQHRDRRSGKVRDLVARPHRTLDVVPFFERDGHRYVLARASYPRPLLAAAPETSAVEGGCGHVCEPLMVFESDRPVAETVEHFLRDAAGIQPPHIRCFHEGSLYYPSPGGVLEEVRSVLVELEENVGFVQTPLEPVSGFSSSGRVHAIEAQQLLRAAQVGGLPDARLELNTYHLLGRVQQSVGPWLGEEIQLLDAHGIEPGCVSRLLDAPGRRLYEAAGQAQSPGFLRVGCHRYEELAPGGEVLGARVLEHVVPAALSLRTVAVAALARVGGAVMIGVDDDDLPAAQSFAGNSNLPVCPAWRLPHGVVGRAASAQWIRARLLEEYGLETGRLSILGGRYHPSSGTTPEIVQPLAFEVLGEGRGARHLSWLPLAELAGRAALLRDGHLRLVTLRGAHAAGLLA